MKKNPNAPDISVEQNSEAVKMEVVANNSENEILKEKEVPALLKVIKSVKEETQLLTQWEKLDSTERELDNFVFGGDNLRDTLTIKDSDGHAFSTNNSFLIQKVTNLLKELVSDKRQEIEKELTTRRLAA